MQHAKHRVIRALGILAAGSIMLAAEVAATQPAALPTTGGRFGGAGQFAISGELSLNFNRHGDGGSDYLIQPALDYFIVDNISVGGVIGISGGSNADNTGWGPDFRFGVRAGLNLPIGDIISFWPTVGMYANGDTHLGIYAPFLLHVVPHLFIGFGPYFNAGDGWTAFGLASTVGGWF